jgi:hypothetical protein
MCLHYRQREGHMKQKPVKNSCRLIRANLALAKKLWPGQLCKPHVKALENLTLSYGISVVSGDLQLLENRWYVTHSGLLSLAERKGCLGIRVEPIRSYCDPLAKRWVFRAIVFKKTGLKGFAGFGDADPSNVSPIVRGAEMRVAETRAVNRALRKAYGIGICSVEELGYLSSPHERVQGEGIDSSHSNGNGSRTSQPRLRDKLCLLIRKYELDPNLVKRYAADFCGTEALRDASRDLIEAFISRLAEEAAKDRAALICKLNSYNQLEEVKS